MCFYSGRKGIPIYTYNIIKHIIWGILHSRCGELPPFRLRQFTPRPEFWQYDKKTYLRGTKKTR
jgi:hypothetical protein